MADAGPCLYVCMGVCRCPIGDGGFMLMVRQGAFGVEYYVYVIAAYHFTKYCTLPL